MNVFHTIAVARASLPRLTIAQHVVDTIVQNALVYDTETGQSLVGFPVKVLGRPEPDLYVIDTISPDEEDTVRRAAQFVQGDEWQSEIFAWWSDNWDQYRTRRRGSYGNALGAKWDVSLAHLGDWHKHPGTLTEPSWGDSDTARHHISDPEAKTPQLLAILATVWDRAYSERVDPPEAVENNMHVAPLRIPIDAQKLVRIDCWYMSRMTRRFVRLGPQVVADRLLPTLPALGWHLTNLDRMDRETEALRQEGYVMSVWTYDADELPPLEVCLMLDRYRAQHILIVVTDADYPATMPKIRVAPASAVNDIPKDADLFTELWKKSEPVPKDAYPTWEWTPTRTILDLVKAVEAKLPERNAAP